LRETHAIPDDSRIFIAVGANMGDRVGNIRRAVKALDAAGMRVIHTGRLYESEPMYVEDQERFVNSVIEVSDIPLIPHNGPD
jgi:dihydroneopterin aldolase/2-amino-4-hydroxy-6-hydroxymethyldihydropteridine diphosphokinase/dihydropteroate synthase